MAGVEKSEAQKPKIDSTGRDEVEAALAREFASYLKAINGALLSDIHEQQQAIKEALKKSRRRQDIQLGGILLLVGLISFLIYKIVFP